MPGQRERAARQDHRRQEGAVSAERKTNVLLPCPFCGRPGELREHFQVWSAGCTPCGINMYAVDSTNRTDTLTRAGAIAAWNRRTPETA